MVVEAVEEEVVELTGQPKLLRSPLSLSTTCNGTEGGGERWRNEEGEAVDERWVNRLKERKGKAE